MDHVAIDLGEGNPKFACGRQTARSSSSAGCGPRTCHNQQLHIVPMADCRPVAWPLSFFARRQRARPSRVARGRLHNVSTNRDESGRWLSTPVHPCRIRKVLLLRGLWPEPPRCQSVARSGRFLFDSFPAHHSTRLQLASRAEGSLMASPRRVECPERVLSSHESKNNQPSLWIPAKAVRRSAPVLLERVGGPLLSARASAGFASTELLVRTATAERCQLADRADRGIVTGG